MEEIDERYITAEFLSRVFPSSSSEQSKRKYIEFRDKLNQKRRVGGKSPVYDAELSDILSEYSNNC